MMRALLLTAVFLLTGNVAAHAHWPVTYVGSPEIHRMDGTVRHVTLLQPMDELERAPDTGAGRDRKIDPECAIETAPFLQEPASQEKLFQNDDVFAPELDRPSRIEELVFGGVVIGR